MDTFPTLKKLYKLYMFPDELHEEAFSEHGGFSSRDNAHSD